MPNTESFGQRFNLTLITSDLTLAAVANLSAVDRIGVDLETVGKAARQQGFVTRLSKHTLSDLAALAEVIPQHKLFVRINPLDNNTPEEIERVIEIGASYVMLPYFNGAAEVEKFIRLIDGRAATIALVETASAVAGIKQISSLPGLDEIMLGLNDLRLSLAAHNHFEILVSPLVQALSEAVHQAGIRFSLGGVAPPGYKHLPVDPDLILAQYPRLGASGAWIARSFFQDCQNHADLNGLIVAIRDRLDQHEACNPAELEQKRKQLAIESELIKAAGIRL